ncbi:MAG TPA: glycoside hydrolase family 16 protein [Stellaceae bacterium]|jgi:beta-glucanase (GH16 family)|nr:glycoside hydrolase family 16 protein [Stellaceae bacterium]
MSKSVTPIRSLAIAVGSAMSMVIGYAWAGPPAGYVRVFDDQFTTPTLDTHKWWTRLRENGGTAQSIPSNHEQQRYVENVGTHVMTGHSIQLIAKAQTADGTYPSGMIRSKQLFDLAGGAGFYFETRAKVPGGQGSWPGFWLASDKRPNGSLAWPPEIDIMEFINANDTDNIHTLHCGIETNDDQKGYKASFTQVVDGFDGVNSKWPTNIDFSAGFHTYALLYKQPNFTIWMDGTLVLSGTYLWVWPDHTPAPPAHVIAQLAVGGTAGRNGITAKFSQVLEINYIHVDKEVLPDRSPRRRS